jgi:ATPase subunit of ABC transporter with duplicated ATPase domains
LRTTSDDASVESLNHHKAETLRLQRGNLEKERHLTSIYEKSKKENEKTKGKLVASQKKMKDLQNQLASTKYPEESQRQLEKQRKRIDELERQLVELQEQDSEDDELIIPRGFLDEDLEDSVARQFMGKLDCGAYSMLGYNRAC